MTELIIIIGIALFMAACVSRYYDENKGIWITEGYGNVIIVMIFLLLAVFVGLRTRMNDTGAYRHGYELTALFPDILNGFDWSLGSNPGFNILNSLIKTAGFSTQSFLMIYSLITNGLYIRFLKRYSSNFLLSLFLFITTGVYLFTAAAIKQAFATALALYALDFAIQKKWVRFIAIILLAMTFHPYVLVYFAVPFLMFKPGTRRTYVLMLGTVVGAIIMQRYMGVIVGFTEAFGDSYSVEEFSGAGVNLFRIAVCNVPLVLLFWFNRSLYLKSDRANSLIGNLTMVNGIIMFLGIFGTANYFARLANFFLCTQAITIPYMLKQMKEKDRTFFTIATVMGYTLYFCYEKIILYPFSTNFERTELFEYLFHNIFII